MLHATCLSLGDVGEGFLRVDDLDEVVPLLGLFAERHGGVAVVVFYGRVGSGFDELRHAHRVADGDGVHERGPAVAVHRVEVDVLLDELRVKGWFVGDGRDGSGFGSRVWRSWNLTQR